MVVAFLRVIEEQFVHGRWGHNAIRRLSEFECDHCGVVFVKKTQARDSIPDRLTFCSRPARCYAESSRSGKLAAKRERVFTDKYGVKTPSMLDSCKQKMLDTRVERYGTVAPIHEHPEIAAKWRATMTTRLGVEHPSKSEVVKAKKQVTNIERYGVPSPFAVGSPFRSSDDCAKGGQAAYRALYAKKGDEMHLMSKPERDLGRLLKQWFGDDQVIGQVEVHHGGRRPWLVDFYVSAIDTYVQMDGVFWHGLYEGDDHPKAVKARVSDTEQNEWFAGNGMRLVRITDQQLIQCQRSNDFSDILVRLGG